MSTTSEEELPDLDSVPMTTGENSEDEDYEEIIRDDSNSENDEEELPSLPNSPAGPSESAGMETEEVPDLVNVSSGSADLAEAEGPRGGIDPQAQASSQPVDMDNINTAAERRGPPVRSFRTRVDEDGEVVFEFASDEDEDEEDDPDYNPGVMAASSSIVPPAGPRVHRNPSDLLDHLIRQPRPTPAQIHSALVRAGANNVGNVDNAGTNTANRYRRRGRPVGRGGGETVQHLQPDRESDDDEDYDSDYTPSRPFNTESSEPLGSRRAPPSSSGRRKKRKPKKKKIKVPKIKRPPAPPKPLKPKVVYEDLSGNESLDLYRQKISSETSYKLQINYGTPDSDNMMPAANNSKKDVTGYKIGEIFLKDVGLKPWTFRNREELLDNFPGLVEFTIHVSDLPTLSVIKLKTEEKLSDEESASRPRPPKFCGRKESERSLIFVLNRNYFFHFDPVGIPSEMFSQKGLGSKKCFSLDFIGFDENSKDLQFDVMLLQSAIVGEHELSDIPYVQGQGLLNVFSHFFKVDPPPKPLDDETRQKEDIAWFYGQLKKYHAQEVLPELDFSLQPSYFVPLLRNYQKDAVRWMLFKEGVSINPQSQESQPSASKDTRLDLIESFLQKMYVPVKIEVPVDEQLELKPAYYNPYAGYVCWSRPVVPTLASGGVLADEMGLGKTVEVLCLILLNQKPKEDDARKFEEDYEVENIYTDIEDVSSEESDGNPDVTTEKNRKRSILRKRRKSRKRIKTEKDKLMRNEVVESAATLQRPQRLRKRKSSPCEFVSLNVGDQELMDSDEEQYEDIDDSDPDFSDELSQNQNLTSTNTKGRKVKITKGKINKIKDNDRDFGHLRHPKLKRRRMSPCEFTSVCKDESSELVNLRNSTPRRAKQIATSVIAEIVKSEIPNPNVNENSSPRTSVAESSEARVPLPSSSTSKKSRRNSTTTTDQPMTTYQRVKQTYDEVLRGYSETAQAKVVPRFHGTFFETSIRRRACFECICGGYNDDDVRRVVTCTTCDSSQHAECVGFNKLVEKRMLSENKSYLCPHCAVMEKPYAAKTTLIITPNSISYQWINEIQRHVKNHPLNILFYKGVTTHGYIPPAKLAEYDIIITTYAVLSSELNYVDLPHCNSEDGRRFRNAKRFLTIPSPLPCVLWWRVCLDEAQMVEGINTKMSLMAMRIHAVHRWCVTGTPINKGLQDLFGLFAFLGVQPISLDYWWERLVQDPFHRKDVSLLYEIFGQLIWRTSKPDVLEQLGIPPQTEMSHWLRFSPVETHFYKQQYEICSNKILGKIARLRQTSSNNILETRLSNLDRKTLQALLQPFLELRQACCHPQMVKGQLISLQKGTLTMEELLAQLVKKTSLQCAEDHRLIVAALNGMAGIHMLREGWVAASEKYREVLQSAEKNKKHFPTDSLQLLHTLENLADLVDQHHEGVPFTLRDDSLREQAEVLKKKYLQKYANGVKAAKEAVQPLSQVAEQLLDKRQCKDQSWWSATLEKAASLHKIDDLISRIKDDLIDHTKKNNSVITLANKFNDSNGLQRVLVETIIKMESLRQSVLKGLEDLQQQEPSSFVHGAVCCHLRKKSEMYYKDTDESGFRCRLCKDHGNFLQYESILFKEEKKNKVLRTGRKRQQQKLMGVMATDLTEEEKNLALLKEEEELLESLDHVNVGISDDLRRGTWGDSDTERILKLINNFARVNGLPSKVTNDGSTHLKLFESMKKEFRVLRILWRQIYDQVSAVDELSQATTRLRLRDANEEPVASSSRPSARKPKELKSGTSEDDQKIQNIHVLERHELETKLAQMQLDIDRGKESLSIHMGQLLYLDTLKKNGYGKKGTSNPDDCPICQNQLGMEWSVLRCGHSYCSDCVKKMCPNTLHSFLCPLCRHAMKYADVSFVDTREPEKNDAAENEASSKKKEIRGSHSAKVEAIIKTLFNLQETHPGEKALIFSTWVDVLEIIAKALDQNDIPNCLLNKPGKHFQTNLHRFKTREDVQVLLMPITSGSKGLNIVEASHVILVEPILNLASELQAIGRVHRIGQTKSTCVHRYYVEKTIEEQLFEILKTHDVSSDDEGSLSVADLQNLIRSGQSNA